MILEDIGLNENIKKNISETDFSGFDIGRIIAEYKERYILVTEKEEFYAEITGNMRFTAKDRSDFPAVGDWVAVVIYENNFAIIHKIFPRYSLISRKASGKTNNIQLIAANIDFAFIVQSTDRDFNINRIERYLSICNSSSIEPIIILSKSDLISKEKLNDLITMLNNRLKDLKIIPISNETFEGISEIEKIILKGKTYCLLGSSGVGKSSLINNLLKKEILKTGTISQSANKGKHTTTNRELIILENGGILIDNPGMREVGLYDIDDGIEKTFHDISKLSKYCKFSNCKHISEIGCKVIESVKNGEIDKAYYENYLKLEREKLHFEASIAEKRQKDKNFGKIKKNYKKYNSEY